MIYTSLFTIIALFFGVHFYKSRYPEDFDTIIVNISTNIQQNEAIKPYLPMLSSLAYYAIYVYSFCQIVFSKTINFCVPYINLAVKRIFNVISKPGIEPLQNVKDQNIICTTTLKQLDTDDGDLVLIKSPTNDVIILDKVPDTLDNLKYEVSNVRFLAIYLKLNVSNSHIIELFNNDANYYVVGNNLDSKFFKYYLHNVLNIKVDNESPFEYKLEIMDHNVNMIYVNEKQSILIEKDGYEISLLSEAKGETTEISDPKKEETSETKEILSETESETKEAETETKEAEAEAEPKSTIITSFDDTLEVEPAKELLSEPKENGLDASTIYY